MAAKPTPDYTSLRRASASLSGLILWLLPGGSDEEADEMRVILDGGAMLRLLTEIAKGAPWMLHEALEQRLLERFRDEMEPLLRGND